MMHIAFCTDTNYVMPCGVAMTSICENNKEDEITFHLVITDEGTSLDEVEKKVAPLKDIVLAYDKHVSIYRMDAGRLSSFVCSGAKHVSTSAFSRIFLPEILPADILKVLYLDCDLVCDGSLKELWDIDLETDCPLGAVVDCNYAAPAFHIQAEIPQYVHYINSGVLLMNLDCWRRNNYIELAIRVAEEKKFPLLDQDTLNHIFCGKIKYLPVKYNLLLVVLLDGIDKCHLTLDFYSEIKEACEHPVIIHYLTAHKPWKNELCPRREIWEKYKQMTIWRDLTPTPIITKFEWTTVYSEFIGTYWMDPSLFIEGLRPYLRAFRALIKIKNKKFVVSCITSFLNFLASILEKMYSRKIWQ